jgi:hypothetical protein
MNPQSYLKPVFKAFCIFWGLAAVGMKVVWKREKPDYRD